MDWEQGADRDRGTDWEQGVDRDWDGVRLLIHFPLIDLESSLSHSHSPLLLEERSFFHLCFFRQFFPSFWPPPVLVVLLLLGVPVSWVSDLAVLSVPDHSSQTLLSHFDLSPRSCQRFLFFLHIHDSSVTGNLHSLS